RQRTANPAPLASRQVPFATSCPRLGRRNGYSKPSGCFVESYLHCQHFECFFVYGLFLVVLFHLFLSGIGNNFELGCKHWFARLAINMSALDTAKEIGRIAAATTLGKDVIDLLEKKITLLTEQVTTLEAENKNLKVKVHDLEQERNRLQPKP